ncbi:LuxR C-terminal-related transcriptional regulator [Streptomyces sp. NPDC046465]|uniref:helix-turn-helix transcriptional regulator n=1 Tax=Streptomyces sp. NPDC046465 TaxID=3155810 RepID=UPI0033FBFCAD
MVLSTPLPHPLTPLPRPPASPGLFGRAAETAAVRALVERARAGRGGALVLSAPPGLGRTALVEYARTLCAPPAEGRPTPSAAPRPQGPLLVCLDDVHRWDAASRAALGARLRRPSAAGEVALLVSVAEGRTGAGEFTGPATLHLAPLEESAATALLHRLTHGRADPAVAAWLVREAAGNPRLLTSYAAALTPAQLAGRARLPDPLPGAEGVLDDYTARLQELPGAARTLLLLAAAAAEHEAEGAGAELALVLRAGGDDAGLAPAEAAGAVLAAGGRLRFPQPLLRAAVLCGTPPARRRAAHLRLAGACRDPYARLVQLACAAQGHDASLAGRLAAAAAGRPHAERATALARAAALSADAAARTGRLAEAADAARLAGDAVRARALLARTGPLPAHGGVQRVRGLLALADGPVDDARQLLLAAAALLPPRQARGALTGAAQAAWAAGDAGACREAMARLPVCADDPLLEAYRRGMCALLSGRTAQGHALLRRCLNGPAGPGDPAGLLRAGATALVVGDLGAAREAGARALAAVRAHGPEVLVPRALELLAYAELRAGRHTGARAHAAEGLGAAQRSGQTNTAVCLHAVAALAASVEGDAGACALHAAAAAAGAGPHGLTQAATLAGWALARAELAAGRCADAAARLAPLIAPGPRGGHFAVRMLAVPCFVEAALQAGQAAQAARAGQARRATAEFAHWAKATADPLAPAQLARCYALLAPPPQKAAAFERALARHESVPGEFERGRTQLLYGQWLRRGRHTRQARGPLRDALVAFERCGAHVWAERSRGELRAAGEAVAGRAGAGEGRPGLLAALTPQQQRIARQVAEGATNREVAVRLSVSHRTVDHHLRNVFAVLGVRSRVELSRLLADDGDGRGGRSGGGGVRGREGEAAARS